ncbi:MAG TPA: SCO family protein, partial [Candidatus Binataceae bacterium]|nr:SCO family protein [Candidatus Binataceae bacterium]
MYRFGGNWKNRARVTRPRFAAIMASIAGFTAAALLVGSVLSSQAAATANYLPDITLENQHRQSLSLASLRGKPVLVGFIHTMCKGPCEMLTSKMQSVSAALPAAHNVTMLLITTDPADDQPPELMAYAKKQSLSGNEWILVTGPHRSIKRVMRIYGVSHEESDDTMMHVMKLFLVAPDGSLTHTYSGMNASPQAVASDIKTLSRQDSAASQHSSSLQ